MEFMKSSLAQSTTPRFRDFWEARRRCLPLFKESIAPKARAELWQEYVELSTEARRLKEILDEQSAFAYEQIELAIQALTSDLEQYQPILAQSLDIEIPAECSILQEKKETYNSLQKELNLLNTLASRVNSLRKEVIKTEMRVRNKNKLFDKLSSCGDLVFPRRKELIKQISDQFIGDVQSFVTKYFETETDQLPPLHMLREEIKALQSVAKILTLNTHSFTETRLKLSECWDKIKNLDKERKKEISQKKHQQRQAVEQVLEKIKAFETFCLTQPTRDEAGKQFEEILGFMRTVELNHYEQKSLKDELFKARRPVWDRERLEQEAQENREKEIENKKKQKVQDLRNGITELLQKADDMDLKAFTEEKDALVKQFEEISISKAEKLVFERLFKQLKDAVHEKKSKTLLDLPQSDLDQLEELKKMLTERKERRQEIKAQLETYRKTLGGSGFDFEKAMSVREMIETEKMSLEKINSAIDELEEKIAQIEG